MLPEQKPDIPQGPEDHEEPSTSQRPDYIPEAYWDADAGEAKIKELVKSLTDTQTALRNRADELKQELIKELNEGIPDEPGLYEVSMPELDGKQVQMDIEDPLFDEFKVWAHKSGINQDKFNDLLKFQARWLQSKVPNIEAEIGKLGDKAKERIDSVTRFASSALDQGDWETFRGMMTTARSIEVMEKLMGAAKGKGPSSFDQYDHAGPVNEAEVDRLMATDKYWKGDTATVRRVEELVQRIAKRRPSR